MCNNIRWYVLQATVVWRVCGVAWHFFVLLQATRFVYVSFVTRWEGKAADSKCSTALSCSQFLAFSLLPLLHCHCHVLSWLTVRLISTCTIVSLRTPVYCLSCLHAPSLCRLLLLGVVLTGNLHKMTSRPLFTDLGVRIILPSRLRVYLCMHRRMSRTRTRTSWWRR